MHPSFERLNEYNVNNSNKILYLSLPLAALIIIASISGLSTEGFYSTETLNWQAQSLGQDAIDLFVITPALIITAIFITRKNKTAFFVWSGINIYLIYTFVIYCFDLHFNSLFIVYCLILGLSFYSVLYFLFSQIHKQVEKEIFNKTVVKIIAVYLLIISVLFYFLWLSEIIPAIIHHQTPKSLVETGLLTNPIQVIDLSVILPGLFLIFIFLMQKRPVGLLLLPGALVFCILMDITIGWLIIAMKIKGLEVDYLIAVIMGILAVLNIVLLIWYFRKMKYSHAW